jgi:hypothetical protein
MDNEQSLRKLIEFLRLNPESAKFLPAILKDYSILQENRQAKQLNGDPISQQIFLYLLSQLVVNQEDLCKIMRLTPKEIRGRMSFMESQLNREVQVDRTNPEKWIMFLKEEALVNG